MAADSGFADPDDDEDSALRPAWEDTEDETDADRRDSARGRRPSATHRSSGPTPGSPTPICARCSARSVLRPTCSPGSTPACRGRT